MTNYVGIARAHTNIALIKYWGKKNKELFLPMNSSLSLTLDAFYTDTKITLDSHFNSDCFYLNGEKQDDKNTQKISQFLNLFRSQMNEYLYAKVESYNFVPTAAGLASSASAFAALATAMNEASNLQFSLDVLSTYARRGSGSATRSIYGGFVEWQMGTANHNSKAIYIDPANFDIAMLIIVVNAKQKKISSRIGMEHTVLTSPFYQEWIKTAKQDLVAIKEAIQQQDIRLIGEITEANAMKMHATTLSANPPFTYFEPESLIAQQAVTSLREKGYTAYYTMDAGPNVKVLCKKSQLTAIQKELEQYFNKEQLIPSNVGDGVRLLTEQEWEQSIQQFNSEVQ